MPYNLLFADDSATMHRVVQITFAREDFSITGVNSGAAAVAKAKEVKPDIAVIDISMPGMDGYAVCQSIKSDPATAHIPVLLLAGSQEPFDEARAQASGANSHVVKPFETHVLVDRVKTLVGAPITAATAPVARPAVAAPVQAPAPAPAPVAARPAPVPVAPAPVAQPAAAAKPSSGFGAPLPPSAPTTGGWSMPAAGGPPRPPGAPAAPPSVRPVTAAPVQPVAAPVQPAAVVPPPRPAPVAAPVAAPRAAPVIPVATTVAATVAAVTAKSGEVMSGTLATSGLPLDQAAVVALAREVLERVAWEVVPQMAEALIREQMAKNQGN